MARIALAIFCLGWLVDLPVVESATAGAKDVYDLPPAVAIEGRNNLNDTSLSFDIGYLPVDSFNKGFPLSLSYSRPLKTYLSWEVLNLGYVVNRESQLKTDIRAQAPGVSNIGFGGVMDFPKITAMTGVVYTPLYGKSLWFNRSLVRSETGLYLGAGLIQFDKSGVEPAFAPGLQTRFFVSKTSALRLYVRQYFIKDQSLGITGVTNFGIGYEFLSAPGANDNSTDEDE